MLELSMGLFFQNWRFIVMLSNELLHPDHVVPGVEFEAAFGEFADEAVATVFVEFNATQGEVGVL